MASRRVFLHPSQGGQSRTDYYGQLTQVLLTTHDQVEICSEQSVYDSCLQRQGQSSDDEFVVVVDIVRCQHEAAPFLKGLCSGELTQKTRIILISSLLTWSSTKSNTCSMENNGLRLRIPMHAYTETLQLENSFYALSSQSTEVVVIGRGLIYGRGGFDFHPIIQSLLKDEHVVPLLRPSDSAVPAIHIDDFCEIINFAISSESIPLYIPAIDSCCDSLHSILSCIAHELDVQQFKYSELDEAFQFAVENPEITNLFQFNKSFTGFPMIEIPWRFQLGLSDSDISAVVSEYRALNNLSPCRLMVVGMPFVGKSSLSRIIAQK